VGIDGANPVLEFNAVSTDGQATIEQSSTTASTAIYGASGYALGADIFLNGNGYSDGDALDVGGVGFPSRRELCSVSVL